MEHWKQLTRTGCHDITDLADRLSLTPAELGQLQQVQETYPLLVNDYYLSLIDPADPDDPIRRLSIPSTEELDLAGLDDTSGERSNTVIPGLQHKYAQTALLLSTSACAMYCRHCFRRRFVGVSGEETVQSIDEVAEYIREHAEITNVLVSGGDAFMNSNATIARYLELLCAIDHLQVIRFGTRTPVVLPQRITSDDELTDLLAEYAGVKQLYVVTQFDHPRELTPEAKAAIRQLLELGIPVRNQTVLLRGVNDDPATLAQLMNGLSACGAIPYYLFQCRPVTGVKNRFQVPLREGYRIVEAAKTQLNGPAKCFRYAMSHPTGKIEILGELEPGTMLFKYHQAKDPAELGKLFTKELDGTECWL